MGRLDSLRKSRLDKLEEIRKLGVNPYPASLQFSGRAQVSDALKKLGKEAIVAGRLTAWREHGGSIFADLKDESGKIQLFFKKDVLGEKKFGFLELLDFGDFIEVKGKVFKTKAGEITIEVKDFNLLTKSIRPLPSKWHGLKDVEERYRQRYVDLLLNDQVRKVFEIRSALVKALRHFLDEAGFIEVETPILQPIYGGAAAKPFITHHNVLNTDLYLRIADELYLKRLIVGGFEKVYELGKDFRNEGIDKAHNPEFTQLEFYWAFVDYQDLMKFTEEMLSTVIREVMGTLKIKFDDGEIDFTPPWKRISYREAILEQTKIDIDKENTEEKLLKAIKREKISLDLEGAVGFGAVLDSLYKKTTRPNLKGPLFLTDRPTEFVSLAKRREDDSSKTASFQLLVRGVELINAYNELNDPLDQAERWQESEKLGKKGLAEHEAFDEDYIRALEYGMPPTAGWGLGIDRLCFILTDAPSLKEVILFPTLRPEK
jgi:lysyl-tRNA synthetase class 2